MSNPTQASPDIWETLKTDALNFWQTLTGDAATVAKNLETVVAKDVPIVLEQLTPLAYELVAGFAQAQFTQWTGGQKSAAVDASLLAVAKSKGLKLLSQDAGMLRQQAVNALGLTAPQVRA